MQCVTQSQLKQRALASCRQHMVPPLLMREGSSFCSHSSLACSPRKMKAGAMASIARKSGTAFGLQLAKPYRHASWKFPIKLLGVQVLNSIGIPRLWRLSKTAQNPQHKCRPNKDLATVIIERRDLNYWKGSEQCIPYNRQGWDYSSAWDRGNVNAPGNIWKPVCKQSKLNMRIRKTHIIVEETPKYLSSCWFLAAFPVCCSAGGTHRSVGGETWGADFLPSELPKNMHQLVGRKMIVEGKRNRIRIHSVDLNFKLLWPRFFKPQFWNGICKDFTEFFCSLYETKHLSVTLLLVWDIVQELSPKLCSLLVNLMAIKYYMIN